MNQRDHRGAPTAEEIEAYIAKEFGTVKASKKKLLRPPGWDGDESVAVGEVDSAEDFER